MSVYEPVFTFISVQKFECSLSGPRRKNNRLGLTRRRIRWTVKISYRVQLHHVNQIPVDPKVLVRAKAKPQEVWNILIKMSIFVQSKNWRAKKWSDREDGLGVLNKTRHEEMKKLIKLLLLIPILWLSNSILCATASRAICSFRWHDQVISTEKHSPHQNIYIFGNRAQLTSPERNSGCGGFTEIEFQETSFNYSTV